MTNSENLLHKRKGMFVKAFQHMEEELFDSRFHNLQWGTSDCCLEAQRKINTNPDFNLKGYELRHSLLYLASFPYYIESATFSFFMFSFQLGKNGPDILHRLADPRSDGNH